MNIANPSETEISQAAEAVKHYREVLKRGKSYSTEEDTMMLEMYQQIARGRAVVNAFEMITAGGSDDLQRPNLFLARAGWPHVIWSFGSEGMGMFRDPRKQTWERGTRHMIHLPHRTLTHTNRHQSDWVSIVPNIPPALRPRGRLDGYIILSEAKWEKFATAAPKDPALLRPIKWPLCAVVAVWDLTPLEQMVLGITRRQ